MAIDYDTDPTGLFVRLGKLVKYIDSHATDATTTLPAELKAIADKFELSDLTGQIAGLYDDFTTFQGNITSLRQTLAGYADAIFTDRDTVLEQLNLPSADATAALVDLFRQMAVDSESINASVVSIGSITAGGSNVGNGTILTTKLLDAYNPPLAGGPVVLQYAGIDSELAVPAETMTFVCTRDSGRDGATEGAETFDWTGEAVDTDFGWQDEGSGQGPSLTVGGGSTIIQDGNFENWTSTNTPSNWTLSTSTVAGTHVFRESTTIYRGTYSLKFLGTGALASMGVEQIPSTMTARRAYNVSLRMRCDSVPAAGTFECLFTGTGYSAASSEKISIAAASLPTSFTLYNFFVVLPSNVPTDWTLVVRVTNTLTNGRAVYVDSLCVSEVQYHGGIGAVAVPGSTRFVAGDRFTSAISSTEGVFQRFFRRKYRLQLRSDNAAGETISDTLAT